MEEPLPTRRTTWRPRFSLLSALLLMTVVCLAIVTAQLWREIGPLRAEVRRLRDEVGVLSIDDPTKVSAIRVRTNEDYTWKWRIWVPDGRSYAIKYSGESIPKNGTPKASGYITLSQTGETWIEYKIRPEVGTKRWADTLETPHGSVGGASQEWVKWKQQTGSGDGVGHTTKSFEPDKVIVLARQRISQTAKSSDKIEDPSAGFMIWLEPTP
jgi:hypothetical protein